MSEPDLGILLTASLRGFVDLLHAQLGAQGYGDVRPAFGVVFRALRDGPLTLTALAGRLGVTKQAAAKVVDEMERKGLLVRRADPADARAKGLVDMLLPTSVGGALQTVTAKEHRVIER